MFGKHTAALFLLLSISLLPTQGQDQRSLDRRGDVDSHCTSPQLYQRWLEEDVRWIITDQQRADFKSLTTDKQRDQFVEAFWERRNPNPGASENTFKEEHYRRIAYTNQHFAAVVPGWKTDRGRIYIMYGAPDKVDHYFSAAGSESAASIVGPGAIPYDWELWHYSHLEGLGRDVNFTFVDTCACGEYRMPIEKDDLRKYAPR